ncbi:hypothetical protein C8J57DRAFT_1214986 [Mycena rebaudengoi]|nr:hypothetical protein C8J57DRAFT_1214986 [Mycena rebaudengoi]
MSEKGGKKRVEEMSHHWTGSERDAESPMLQTSFLRCGMLVEEKVRHRAQIMGEWRQWRRLHATFGGCGEYLMFNSGGGGGEERKADQRRPIQTPVIRQHYSRPLGSSEWGTIIDVFYDQKYCPLGRDWLDSLSTLRNFIVNYLDTRGDIRSSGGIRRHKAAEDGSPVRIPISGKWKDRIPIRPCQGYQADRQLLVTFEPYVHPSGLTG